MRHIVVLHFDDFGSRGLGAPGERVPTRPLTYRPDEALPKRLSCPLKRLTHRPGRRGVRPCLRASPSASETPAPMFYPPLPEGFHRRIEGPIISRGESRSDWRCVHAGSRRKVSAFTGVGGGGPLAKATLSHGCRAPPSTAPIWLLERCKRRHTHGSVLPQRPPSLRWAPRSNCSDCGRRASRNREGCRDEWTERSEVRTRRPPIHPSLPPNQGGARNPD